MVRPTKDITPYEPATFGGETTKIECRNGSTISWKVFRDIVSEKSTCFRDSRRRSKLHFLSKNVMVCLRNIKEASVKGAENERKVG